MNGFDRTKTVLEYDKITASLAQYAVTDGAKEKLRALEPSCDLHTVEKLLDETERALELITFKGSPTFSAPPGIPDSVSRADKGAMLTMPELLSVASLLRAVTYIKKYPDGRDTGALSAYFSALTENKGLSDEITMKIIGEDTLADDASPERYRLRREIRRAEDKQKREPITVPL